MPFDQALVLKRVHGDNELTEKVMEVLKVVEERFTDLSCHFKDLEVIEESLS